MMTFSHQTNDHVRGKTIALFTPFWEKILTLKHSILHPFSPFPSSSLTTQEKEEKLKLDNLVLELKNEFLEKQIEEQLFLNDKIVQISKFNAEEASLLALENKESLSRLIKTMKIRMQAISARVIFRSFDSWNQSLWINVGDSSNGSMEDPPIAMNSPVVVGNVIIGVIDYVGKYQSRVRLITDNRLNPSVRTARGGEQDAILAAQLESLSQILNQKKSTLNLLSQEEQALFNDLLNKLKNELQPLKKTWYLAKGVLQGSLSSHQLSQNVLLKGTGFNYDFADEEGGARDLHSGKLLKDSLSPSFPLIKINDILITTGMDGVFPPGFQVARVTKIGLLKEGDYFYDLEASPLVSSIKELDLVFILPPLSKEKISQKNLNTAKRI